MATKKKKEKVENDLLLEEKFVKPSKMTGTDLVAIMKKHKLSSLVSMINEEKTYKVGWFDDSMNYDKVTEYFGRFVRGKVGPAFTVIDSDTCVIKRYVWVEV